MLWGLSGLFTILLMFIADNNQMNKGAETKSSPTYWLKNRKDKKTHVIISALCGPFMLLIGIIVAIDLAHSLENEK